MKILFLVVLLGLLSFIAASGGFHSHNTLYEDHHWLDEEDEKPISFFPDLDIWRSKVNETNANTFAYTSDVDDFGAATLQTPNRAPYELSCLDSQTLWYFFQNRAFSQRGGKAGADSDVGSPVVFTSGTAAVNCWKEQWVLGNTQRNLLLIIKFTQVQVHQTPVKQDSPEVIGREPGQTKDMSADFVNPVFALISGTGRVLRAFFHTSDSVSTIEMKKKFLSELETSIVKNLRQDITPVGKVENAFAKQNDAQGNLVITKTRNDRSFIQPDANTIPPNSMRQSLTAKATVTSDGRILSTVSAERVEYGGQHHDKGEHAAFAQYVPKTEPNSNPGVTNPEHANSTFTLVFRNAETMGILSKAIATSQWQQVLSRNPSISLTDTNEGFSSYTQWANSLADPDDLPEREGYVLSNTEFAEDHHDDDIVKSWEPEEQMQHITKLHPDSRPFVTKTKIPRFHVHKDWIETNLGMSERLHKHVFGKRAKRVQKMVNLIEELQKLRVDPDNSESNRRVLTYVSFHPQTSLPILFNAFKMAVHDLELGHNNTVCHYLEKLQTWFVVAGSPDAQHWLIETVKMAAALKENPKSALQLVTHAVMISAHVANPTEELAKWLLAMTHFEHQGAPFEEDSEMYHRENYIKDNAYLVYSTVVSKIPQYREVFLKDLEDKIRNSLNKRDRQFYMHALVNAGKYVDVDLIRAIVNTVSIEDEFKALALRALYHKFEHFHDHDDVNDLIHEIVDSENYSDDVRHAAIVAQMERERNMYFRNHGQSVRFFAGILAHRQLSDVLKHAIIAYLVSDGSHIAGEALLKRLPEQQPRQQKNGKGQTEDVTGEDESAAVMGIGDVTDKLSGLAIPAEWENELKCIRASDRESDMICSREPDTVKYFNDKSNQIGGFTQINVARHFLYEKFLGPSITNVYLSLFGYSGIKANFMDEDVPPTADAYEFAMFGRAKLRANVFGVGIDMINGGMELIRMKQSKSDGFYAFALGNAITIKDFTFYANKDAPCPGVSEKDLVQYKLPALKQKFVYTMSFCILYVELGMQTSIGLGVGADYCGSEMRGQLFVKPWFRLDVWVTMGISIIIVDVEGTLTAGMQYALKPFTEVRKEKMCSGIDQEVLPFEIRADATIAILVIFKFEFNIFTFRLPVITNRLMEKCIDGYTETRRKLIGDTLFRRFGCPVKTFVAENPDVKAAAKAIRKFSYMIGGMEKEIVFLQDQYSTAQQERLLQEASSLQREDNDMIAIMKENPDLIFSEYLRWKDSLVAYIDSIQGKLASSQCFSKFTFMAVGGVNDCTAAMSLVAVGAKNFAASATFKQKFIDTEIPKRLARIKARRQEFRDIIATADSNKSLMLFLRRNEIERRTLQLKQTPSAFFDISYNGVPSLALDEPFYLSLYYTSNDRFRVKAEELTDAEENQYFIARFGGELNPTLKEDKNTHAARSEFFRPREVASFFKMIPKADASMTQTEIQNIYTPIAQELEAKLEADFYETRAKYQAILKDVSDQDKARQDEWKAIQNFIDANNTVLYTRLLRSLHPLCKEEIDRFRAHNQLMTVSAYSRNYMDTFTNIYVTKTGTCVNFNRNSNPFNIYYFMPSITQGLPNPAEATVLLRMAGLQLIHPNNQLFQFPNHYSLASLPELGLLRSNAVMQLDWIRRNWDWKETEKYTKNDVMKAMDFFTYQEYTPYASMIKNTWQFMCSTNYEAVGLYNPSTVNNMADGIKQGWFGYIYDEDANMK